MPLKQQPLVLSEMLTRKDQSVYGTLNVALNDEIQIGTLLISSDGGLTWNKRLESDWVTGDSYTTNDIVYYSGHIWKSLADSNTVEPGTDETAWEDQGIWATNGILLEYANITGKCEILKSGYVKEKYVTDFNENLRANLFANSIILQ